MRVGLAVVAGAHRVPLLRPVAWWPAAFVSVAGLTLLSRGASRRLTYLVGLAYGLAFFVPLLTWIRTIGALAWLLLSLTQALELGLLAVGLRSVSRLRLLAAVVRRRLGARGSPARSLPAGRLHLGRWGFSQANGPLLHLAAWGGVPLVSFAVALSGSLLAWAALSLQVHLRLGVRAPGPALDGCRRCRRRRGRAPLAISLPTAAQTTHGPATLTAALVQGNVPRLGLDLDAQRDEVTRNHVAATEALAAQVAAGQVARPQVVIWPENATDVDPRTDPQVNVEVRAAVQAAGVPVLVGAVLDGPGPTHVSNAGVVWDPTTGPGADVRQAPPRPVRRVHPAPVGDRRPDRQLPGHPVRLRARPRQRGPAARARPPSATSSATRWPTTAWCAAASRRAPGCSWSRPTTRPTAVPRARSSWR